MISLVVGNSRWDGHRIVISLAEKGVGWLHMYRWKSGSDRMFEPVSEHFMASKYKQNEKEKKVYRHVPVAACSPTHLRVDKATFSSHVKTKIKI